MDLCKNSAARANCAVSSCELDNAVSSSQLDTAQFARAAEFLHKSITDMLLHHQP